MIRSDRGEQKIKLSLAPGGVVANGNDLDGTPGEKGDVGAPEPGTVVESATVKLVDEATGNVQVTLPGGVPGVVTAAQMSDHPLTGAGLSQAFAPGDEIGPLVALEAKPRRSILSRKASPLRLLAGERFQKTSAAWLSEPSIRVTSRPQPLTPEFSSDSLAVSPVLHLLAAHRRPSRWWR